MKNELEKGDKLFCEKDHYEHIWRGCLFNGMPSPGDVTPTFENKKELDEYKLAPGQSYNFRWYIKGNYYEITDVVRINNSLGDYIYYRIENEEIKGTDFESSLNELSEMKKIFSLDKLIRKKKLNKINEI